MILFVKLNGSYGKWALGLLLAAGLAVLALSVRSLATNLSGPSQAFVYYTVARSDLPIVVTERGNLESQQETTIRCDVESRGYDRSGTSGTQIIFIVPNGSSVKQDDLLVELDSAQIREELADQEIDFEQAKAAEIQARAKRDNQITQNQTAKENAALQVKLAELELKMFTDQESGTYHLAVEEIKRELEDIDNKILAAEASLKLKRNDHRGIEELFKLGYAGKSQLDQSSLELLRARSEREAAIRGLETKLASLDKKQNYERQMELLQLEGNLATAQRNKKQVEVDNVSALAQAEAALDAATKSLQKEEEQLEKLKIQLANCKIYAPHDGMVVYQSEWGRDPIAEGTFVRERQRIIALPNLTKMQVKAYVHESVLDQVDPGQRATVRVDPFPDRTYQGVVESVGVVPADRGRYSRDVKTYETIVKIEGTVGQLKPGMTAVVEIDIDRIPDVLAVPIQAVVQIKQDTWCYVEGDGGVEQRMVELGRTNDKFVHVRDGLAEGERVVLNPEVILEQTQQAGEIGPDQGEPAPLAEDVESIAARGSADGKPPASGRPGTRKPGSAEVSNQRRPGAPDGASRSKPTRPDGPSRGKAGASGGPSRRGPRGSGGPPLRGPAAGG